MATPTPQGVPDLPTCNCALLCEDVLMSAARGKHILHGIVNLVVVASLPATVGPFVSYVRVSNVYGTQELTIRLVSGTDRVVFELRAQLKSPDPLGLYNLVVPIPPFGITEAGRHMFSVLAGGEVLAQSPILVMDHATQEEHDHDHHES